MYVSAKMIPVETMGEGGRIKESSGGDELKHDIIDTLQELL
jgi:hypothetical protein